MILSMLFSLFGDLCVCVSYCPSLSSSILAVAASQALSVLMRVLYLSYLGSTAGDLRAPLTSTILFHSHLSGREDPLCIPESGPSVLYVLQKEPSFERGIQRRWTCSPLGALMAGVPTPLREKERHPGARDPRRLASLGSSGLLMPPPPWPSPGPRRYTWCRGRIEPLCVSSRGSG